MRGGLPNSDSVIAADRDHLSGLAKRLDSVDASCVEAPYFNEWSLKLLLLLLLLVLLFFLFAELL